MSPSSWPTSDAAVLSLWGKTDRKSGRFHPLLFHSADTASVAILLWDEILDDAQRDGLSAGLHLPDHAVRALVGILAGFHDLGKAVPGFQRRWTACRAPQQAEGITDSPFIHEIPHAALSAVMLPIVLHDYGWCSERSLTNRLGMVVGAHFETFPRPSEKFGSDTLGDERWVCVRVALQRLLVQYLDQLAGVHAMDFSSIVLRQDGMNDLAWLVICADRLCDKDHFPASNGIGWEAYQDVAHQRAHAVVQSLKAGTVTLPSRPIFRSGSHLRIDGDTRMPGDTADG